MIDAGGERGLPEMAIVEQHFDSRKIDDVEGSVAHELSKLQLEKSIRPGDSVAITAGSRGIARIDLILRQVVSRLGDLGAKPFIFPAMGSHGGATAEGQRQVLAKLNITEETMGCPIRSDMEPVYLGDATQGYPIYVDRHAAAADHIVVINRIKAHTKFKGSLESGLMKMMAIGMGKQKGASYYHRAAIRLTFQNIVEQVGLEVMRRCPVLFGLGIVENAFHDICAIRALGPDSLRDGEAALLDLAKRRMARLPFDEIDVLIVDQIGKDISGTGMDTNVTGRNIDILGDFTTTPRIKRIFVRNLTDGTEGNAIGIGFADFTTSRLVEKMDKQKTWMNSITAISPEKGSIPIHFSTDREALDACFQTIGEISPRQARVVRILDTLSLQHIQVSRAFQEDIGAHAALVQRGAWQQLCFDSHGNLPALY